MKSKVSTPAANYSATSYAKPTSHIDPITGELVIRVAPATIAALTKRWWSENFGEHDFIRIIDEAGLADAVRVNVHGYDEDWFPGDMCAIESWIGGSGCEAVMDNEALYEFIPMAEVEFPRQVFFGEWRGNQRSTLVDDFDIHRSDLIGAEFLVAVYETGDEWGAASVIFRRGGKLWMVIAAYLDGSGLKGQWIPIETSVGNLRSCLLQPEGDSSDQVQASLHAALDEIEGSEPDRLT